MQLNITTDYAIRMVLYLAMKQGAISSREISEMLGIPKTYISKITKKLENAGLINISVGVYGGFSIEKPANQINLLNIIEAMENK